MANIDLTFPHRLPRPEALARIKKLLTETATRFAGQISDLTENWKGDRGEFSFTAQNQNLSGSVEVGDKEIEVSIKLSFLAKMANGDEIEQVIRENAERILSDPPKASGPIPVVAVAAPLAPVPTPVAKPAATAPASAPEKRAPLQKREHPAKDADLSSEVEKLSRSVDDWRESILTALSK